MKRRRRLGAGTLEREAKDARVGLLVSDERRVDDQVEPAEEADALEKGLDRAIGVGDHPEAVAALAESGERDAGRLRYAGPEVAPSRGILEPVADPVDDAALGLAAVHAEAPQDLSDPEAARGAGLSREPAREVAGKRAPRRGLGARERVGVARGPAHAEPGGEETVVHEHQGVAHVEEYGVDPAVRDRFVSSRRHAASSLALLRSLDATSIGRGRRPLQHEIRPLYLAAERENVPRHAPDRKLDRRRPMRARELEAAYGQLPLLRLDDQEELLRRTELEAHDLDEDAPPVLAEVRGARLDDAAVRAPLSPGAERALHRGGLGWVANDHMRHAGTPAAPLLAAERAIMVAGVGGRHAPAARRVSPRCRLSPTKPGS